MRILFLTHNFPRYAGDVSGSFLLRLATALRDHAAVEARVLAPSAPGYPARDTIDGVDVRRFRYAPRPFETIAYTGNMAADVSTSWRARGALGGMLVAAAIALRHERRQWTPDAVHAHWWFPSGVSASLPGTLGTVPLVVTSHGSDVRLAMTTRGARPMLARVAARATTYTFVSRWLLEQARALVALGPVAVAPMPIDVSRFTPDHRPRDGLLFVGRLNIQKGLADLLRALAQQRTSARLTVVGDGPDAASLRSLAGELGVLERIVWLPSQTQAQLVDHYRAASALVVPSIGEGLGLVAAEAQACGTPVVAFASGGLTDLVVDGRSGLLAPPGDVAALAASLDRVLAHADLAARLGAAGHRDVIERFSPASVARRYAEIYARALRRDGETR